MKRLLLLILFSMPIVSLSAQDSQTYRWDAERGEWVYGGAMYNMPNVYTRTTSYFDLNYHNTWRKPLDLPKNEFAFHFSVNDVPGSMNDSFDDFILDSDEVYYEGTISPWDAINDGSFYLASESTSFIYSLSYLYSPENWVQVGILGTMRYHEYKFKYIFTRQTYNKISDYMFAITPTIRLNYLTTKYFKMYVGVGVSFMWANYETSFTDRDTKFDTLMDFTAFGISIGNRVFAGMEAGYLASGYMKFMFGFRF